MQSTDPQHPTTANGEAFSGPSVSLADIDRAIKAEHYFTAADGAFGAAMRLDGTAQPPADDTSLALLTFCVLTLDNGFTVVGRSACVSRSNFNAQKGREIARENAVEQIWPLLGFRLADRLGAPSASADSVSPYLDEAAKAVQEAVRGLKNAEDEADAIGRIAEERSEACEAASKKLTDARRRLLEVVGIPRNDLRFNR